MKTHKNRQYNDKVKIIMIQKRNYECKSVTENERVFNLNAVKYMDVLCFDGLIFVGFVVFV